ncbi:GatB/YqeY [Candidatus Saccharibacteria bacterium]|nr:MAG: GatB/YqeY [Candidatus Saccharibacteria bacterium]
MPLKQQISDDMKAALLSGNRFEVEVLRGLKAVILNEEVAAGQRDQGLADAEVEKLISREVKKRGESAKLYRDNGRVELAEKEDQEAEILSRYLPEQLSQDDIQKLVQAEIAKLESPSPQNMGQVIGAVKQQAGSSADGAVIAKIAKELLTK